MSFLSPQIDTNFHELSKKADGVGMSSLRRAFFVVAGGMGTFIAQAKALVALALAGRLADFSRLYLTYAFCAFFFWGGNSLLDSTRPRVECFKSVNEDVYDPPKESWATRASPNQERKPNAAGGVGTSSLPRATKDKFGTKKSPEPNQDPGNLI